MSRMALRRIGLAGLVLLLALGGVFVRWRQGECDITRFITAGDRFVNRSAGIAPIRVETHSAGYDGQFFYRLSLDPAVLRPSAFGIRLDNPTTRVERIGYPVLVWAVSLGRPRLVPWAMVLVSLAALFVLAWSSVGLAQWLGLPGRWGLLVPLYPGFLLSLARDTAEVVASGFGMLALASAIRARPWRAAAFGSAAVLTRESTLFYLAGFGLAEAVSAIRQRRVSQRLVAFAVPLAVLLVWQAVLFRLTGSSVYADTGSGDLGVPLRGAWAYVAGRSGAGTGGTGWDDAFWVRIYELGSGVLCAVLPAAPLLLVPGQLLGPAVGRAGGRPGGWAAGMGRPAAPGFGRVALSWLLYAGLALSFAPKVWAEPWGFERVFCDSFVVGSVLIVLSGRAVPIRIMFGLVVPWWCATAWYLGR